MGYGSGRVVWISAVIFFLNDFWVWHWFPVFCLQCKMVFHGDGWHCLPHWSKHYQTSQGNRGTDWVSWLVKAWLVDDQLLYTSKSFFHASNGMLSYHFITRTYERYIENNKPATLSKKYTSFFNQLIPVNLLMQNLQTQVDSVLAKCSSLIICIAPSWRGTELSATKKLFFPFPQLHWALTVQTQPVTI